MSAKAAASIDLVLAVCFSLLAGTWSVVCGLSAPWALAVCGGTFGFTALRDRRLRGIAAVGVCSGVIVGLARAQVSPSVTSIVVGGLAAVLYTAATPRRRRIVATNLIVFGLLLGAGEVGMRATRSFDGAKYFQPIELYRQATEGGPDEVTDLRASVDGGLRRTTDQPAAATRRVLLFGGSTVACAEVSDAQTWPSALQRALGGTSSKWLVENHGQSSATTANRATALKSVADLGPGDLVVFYVGVNDAGLSFTSREHPIPLLVEVPRLSTALKRLSPHSVIADQLVRILIFGGISTSEQARQDAVSDFRVALASAAAHTEARGARFIPVLQSHLFTRANPTDYDRGLAAIYSKRLPDVVDDIYSDLWDVMQEYPGVIDARSAQDGLERSPYYDWHHVDARGNEAIARFIYERIQWNG
jgi:lysophospholipase L1-like esterase